MGCILNKSGKGDVFDQPKSFPKSEKPLLVAKGAPERQTVYLGSISAARIVFVT